MGGHPSQSNRDTCCLSSEIGAEGFDTVKRYVITDNLSARLVFGAFMVYLHPSLVVLRAL